METNIVYEEKIAITAVFSFWKEEDEEDSLQADGGHG